MGYFSSVAKVALPAVLLIAGVSAARAGGKASEVGYYEPVAILSGGEGGGQGGLSLGSSLSLQAFGRRFDMDLEPNDRFAKGGQTVWVGDGAAAGRATDFQLYKGRLRGRGDSWVRLGVINGQLHGMIWTPEEIYVLQPRRELDPSAPAGDTVAYRGRDVDPALREAATCGVTDEPGEGSAVPRELIEDRNADGGSAQGTAIMEASVVVVADYEYYSEAAHGAESDAQLRYLLSLVDAIYEREINISLAVPNTIIFTNSNDPFSSTATPGTLLDELSNFRNISKYCQNAGTVRSCTTDASCSGTGPCVSNLVFGSDLTHLVTNRDLSGTTIGIAWIGTVCSSSHGAGLSQDYSSSTFTMSLLLAHEMGHNFNASHDATSNPCGDPPPRYIMQPCLSSSVVDQFSTASKNQIVPYAENLGCLSPAGTPLPTYTPTATHTPAPPTATPTRTWTRTSTWTPTFTATRTPSRTSTSTPTRTSTLTPTNTRTPSQTPTHTNTPLPPATFTATPTNWPAAFSGLALWLDASQITGVANGAALATWVDLSGTGHHATQGTATSRPTYQATAVNGLPGVRFDGSNDYLSIAGSVITGSQARTVFVIGRPTVVGNKGFVDLGNGSSTGRAFMLSPEYGVRVSGGSALFNPAATANSAALYVVQLNGTTTSTLSAWVNGVALNTTSVVNATIATGGTGVVGGYGAAPVGTNSFAGDIAEIVVFNRGLAAAERQELEQYFSDKYGLTWQGGSVPTATPTSTAANPPTATATNIPPPPATPTSTLPPSAPTSTPTSTAPSALPTATFTPGGNVPQAVANLVLWLDASQLNGFNDGAAVSSWNDASGQGHHGTQAVFGNQPTYQGNAINGAPALRFDGSDDHLSLAGTVVSGAQARTVFFVVRPDVTGNRGIIDLGNGATTGAGFQISPELGVRVNGGNRLWTPATSTTQPTLGVVQLNGSSTSNLSLWVDGIARTPTTTATIAIQTAGSGTVGSWTAGGNYFDGDIAEIIVYSRALSTAERQTVEQYLSGKYGLGGISAPSEIAGLQLWLDAGQVQGVNPGASIATWLDNSGVGNHAGQTSATNQPTYQPAALNGQPAVRFDGTDDYLSLSAPVVGGNQARTVIWVAQPTIVGNRGIIDLGNGATTGSAFMVTPEHGVRVLGGNRLWSPAASTSVPSIGVVTFGGTTTGDLNAWLNGSPLSVTSTAGTAIQTDGVGSVGAWTLSPDGANNFAGDIAEIIVYDRVLSATERQDIEQLLRAKYGL